MNRRTFFGAGALAAGLLAGCRRDPAAALISRVDSQRLAADREERIRHLAELMAFRVAPTEGRTTPPRPVKVLEMFPELRNLQRAAIRLHPRYSDEPAPGESKLGGQFLWPTNEPYPFSERFKVPFVPVLQLRSEEAPTQLKYPAGMDLMQLFWSPRPSPENGSLKAKLVWRDSRTVGEALAPLPDTTYAYQSLAPVALRLFPEKILEFPDWHTVKVTPFREKIEKWNAHPEIEPIPFYERDLSAAPGTKVGGYPRWLGAANPPSCETCLRGMDYLLTIDSNEWRRSSWIPTEEIERTDGHRGFGRAAGLELPDPGNLHLYECRRCEDRPVQVAS